MTKTDTVRNSTYKHNGLEGFDHSFKECDRGVRKLTKNGLAAYDNQFSVICDRATGADKMLKF